MFATADDVSARLQRDLTTDEKLAAELAIESVTGQIAEAVDRDDDWAEDLDPIPATFRALCVEKAVNALVNSTNAASQSKALGAFSESTTYPRSQDVGSLLSDSEERRARRAWFGTSSASSRATSTVDDVIAAAEDTLETGLEP